MKMDPVVERIQKALDHAGLSWSGSSVKIGLSAQAASKWKKGQISRENLQKLSALTGVNSGWLLDGKGEMLLAGNNVIVESSNAVPVTVRKAPVLSWVQAGNWTNAQAVDMSQVEEWLPLPDNECENCFYLKVQGLSNFPDFLEGDYILVDPDVQYSDMLSGDMIVVRKQDDATFKRLVIETDGTKYLQALNPEFKPNIIKIDHECHFVGQVVDCIRYVYRAKKRARKI